jgi:hypothetical protein
MKELENAKIRELGNWGRRSEIGVVIRYSLSVISYS